ncbi:hypothetical protein BDD12DRAFT_737967, partial [Trichophaea hybrida]
ISDDTSVDAVPTAQDLCMWKGIAPFCMPKCPDGWKKIKWDKCGGSGSCCWTGYKVYCCML